MRTSRMKTIFKIFVPILSVAVLGAVFAEGGGQVLRDQNAVKGEHFDPDDQKASKSPQEAQHTPFS